MFCRLNYLAACLIGFAPIGCASRALGDGIEPQQVDGMIKWVYSYEEGKQLARQNGKPLFVVFRCER